MASLDWSKGPRREEGGNQEASPVHCTSPAHPPLGLGMIQIPYQGFPGPNNSPDFPTFHSQLNQARRADTAWRAQAEGQGKEEGS